MADALVALLLLALSITGLLAVNSNSFALSDKTEAQLTATLIARAIANKHNTQSLSGDVSVSGRVYRWQVDVEHNRGHEDLDLRRIFVTVRWRSRNGNEDLLQLETARFGGGDE